MKKSLSLEMKNPPPFATQQALMTVQMEIRYSLVNVPLLKYRTPTQLKDQRESNNPTITPAKLIFSQNPQIRPPSETSTLIVEF